jgi:hypothetical protein
MAVPLLSAVTSPKHLIADKAYDADSLRNWLRNCSCCGGWNNRLDATGFLTRSIAPSIGGRNLIERLFCRLKNW